MAKIIRTKTEAKGLINLTLSAALALSLLLLWSILAVIGAMVTVAIGNWGWEIF